MKIFKVELKGREAKYIKAEFYKIEKDFVVFFKDELYYQSSVIKSINSDAILLIEEVLPEGE